MFQCIIEKDSLSGSTLFCIYIIPKRIIFSYNYNIPICILISVPDYGKFFDISSFFFIVNNM